MRREAGFTATELLIALAILAILGAMAAPSMTKLIATQRVKSASYDLIADLTFARGEAINRGADVTVQSASGSSDWKPGWNITAAGVTGPIRSQSARDGSFTVSGTTSTVIFHRTGRANGGITFQIQPTQADAVDYMKRCLALDPSGRVRSIEGTCPP